MVLLVVLAVAVAAVVVCAKWVMDREQRRNCLGVQVYVLKRPHVDEFLQKMGELFECVLFTASLGKVCIPDNVVYAVHRHCLLVALTHFHIVETFCNCALLFIMILCLSYARSCSVLAPGEYRTRNFHVAGANLAQAICKQP